MSSSLKPCPGDKRVHLVRDATIQTLYICLVEDKGARRDRLKEELIEARVSKDFIGLDVGEIVDRLAMFITGLREAIERSIREVYGERGPIDISLPFARDDVVNPGEFVGDYIVYEAGRSRIALHVEPKVGWDGYVRMLRETRQTIDILALKSGVLEPLLGNLYYPSLSSPVSYSILLLRLTEQILSSTPPKKIARVEVVSESVVGRPVVYKTIRYLMQGYPLGVYERIRVEPHDYPYMLLAKFHYELARRLSEILDVLYKATGGKEYYEFLVESIELLQSQHVYYLTSPTLHGVFNILVREGVTDQELLEETRRASRVNPYFGLLADLYEMYLSDIGLVYEYVERGEIVPCASSKIYELWVLTRIVEYLEKKLGWSVGIGRYRDLWLTLESVGLKLIYNMPLHGFIAKRLKERRILHGRIHLRPDYVLTRDSGTVVYDAKYKERLRLRDVVSLLAYIAEYAEPVRHGDGKVLMGGFYKLQAPSERVEPVVRNSNLPVKIAVYTYMLDPRMSEDTVMEMVEESLRPLLEHGI
jgi:hypothetical protein